MPRSNAVFITDRRLPKRTVTASVSREAHAGIEAIARRRNLSKATVAGRLLAAIMRRPYLACALLDSEELR